MGNDNQFAIFWLKQIKEKYIHGGDEGYDSCRKRAIDLAIKEFEKPEERWIPVSERLPEERHSVLVYCPEYRNIFCAYYYKDEWIFFGGGCKPIDEKVSHWRVLPESPIEDGGDEE